MQDTVYDKFLEKLVEKAKALTVAHGFDEKSGAGPVVSTLNMSFLVPQASPHSFQARHAWLSLDSMYKSGPCVPLCARTFQAIFQNLHTHVPLARRPSWSDEPISQWP